MATTWSAVNATIRHFDASGGGFCLALDLVLFPHVYGGATSVS